MCAYGPIPIRLEAFGDADDFSGIEDHGWNAGREGGEVEFGELLGFDSEGEGVGEGVAEHDEAVVGEERGAAAGEGADDVGGEFVGAEGRVVGAADVVAAEECDEIVQGGDAAAQAGDGRGVCAVGVKNRAGIGPRTQDREVERQLARRTARVRSI